ncbi:hypothetical protein ES703_71029 [subsurface metagenome]
MKLLVVIVELSIASLKVTLTVVSTATSVASATGEVLDTVGGVVSVSTCVVTPADEPVTVG